MRNKTGMIEMNLGSIIGTVVILTLLFSSTYLLVQNREIKQESTLFKRILYADSQISEVSITSQEGDSYYSEAGFFYEDAEYKSVESSCRLARGYYADSSQKYREIRSELKSSDIKDPLIDIYIESLDLLAEIELNMFEACEHFESASRYYHKYYNTDVPYYDQSYEMGTAKIDAMNEKGCTW